MPLRVKSAKIVGDYLIRASKLKFNRDDRFQSRLERGFKGFALANADKIRADFLNLTAEKYKLILMPQLLNLAAINHDKNAVLGR